LKFPRRRFSQFLKLNSNDVQAFADQDSIPRGELCIMKSKSLRRLFYESEGKGLIGCFLSIVLLLAAAFFAITLGPVYYNNLNFESDVKTEVSRAGARFFDNEAVIKNVMDLARRNEIRLSRENIQVERYAGQVHIKLEYSVPVDLLVTERDWTFKINVSSFIGSL
jgi:hypothetical protein